MIEPAASQGPAAPGSERAKLEKATLGFERVMLAQLLEPLADSAGEEAPAAYKDLLPQTLADAVVDGGGIGLADELQRVLLEERP